MFLTSSEKAFRLFSASVSYYAAFLLCYCVVGWIAPFHFESVLLTIFSTLFGLWGCVLLIVELLFIRHFRSVPGHLWLSAFILSLLISMLLNVDHGVVSNAKCLAWMLIQLLVLVPFAANASREDLAFFFRVSFRVAAIVWSVACLIAIVQYIFGVQYIFTDGSNKFHRQGFTEGRLFGIFIDPNYGAFLSLILIIISYYYKNACPSNSRQNALLNAVITLNWLYFVLAQSRSADLALFAVLVFSGILYFRGLNVFWFSVQSRDMRKRLLCVFGFTLKVLISWFIVIALASAYYQCVLVDDENVSLSHAPEAGQLAMRQDVSAENISNNRFDIWKDYISVSSDYPLFGLSPRNYESLILEKYPDLYICQAFKGQIYLPHNGFIELLISTGLAGAVSITGFLIFTVKGFFSFLRRKSSIDPAMLLTFILLIIICVKSLTFTTPFFTYNVDSIIFWISLGYLARLDRRTVRDRRPLPEPN